MKITIKALKSHITNELTEHAHDGHDLLNCDDDEMDESAPPGGEKVVKALKKDKNIDNPWAVAWSMKNKGDKFKK